MKKLAFYNFAPKAIELMKSYLSDRFQFVKLGDEVSTQRKVSIGVPQAQGSVLGPILLLIFINELIKSAPELEYILLADKTNIFCSEPHILKEHLHRVEDWCLANWLILNSTKTFQIIFKAPNKVLKNPDIYDLQLFSKDISIIRSTKVLGVEIDSNLNFSHISKICKTLNYIFLLLIWLYLDIKTLIDLYYSFFNRHIIYGIEFSAQCDLNQILLLQKSALRSILNIHPRGHVFFKFSSA